MSFSIATRCAFAVLILAAVALFCDRARAADDDAAPLYQADDTVVMTDGHEIKGHVVFEAARTLLRMWLGDGKVVTIPWSQIDRVILSPAKPNTPPVAIFPPPPPTSSSDDDIAVDDGSNDTAHVIFEADSTSTELQQRSLNDSRAWITVCKGRCVDELLLHADYRVGGGGARRSRVFRLAGQANDTIVVTPQTHLKALFVLGITLTSVGGVVLLASADALAQCSGEDSCGPAGPIVAFVLGSALTTLGGAALIATNPSSNVFQHLRSSAGLGAKNSSEHAHASILAASARPNADSPFRSITPQFAPAAHTSPLFTIHF